MSTNRRYARQVDRAVDARLLEMVVRGAGALQTLTAEELALGHDPLTIDPQPKLVRAWVRFGPQAVRVDARLVRWTPRACGITFEIHSTTHRCWVWANAVELVDAL